MNRLRARPSPAPLLLDISTVPADHCDDCLEGLFKALAINPTGKADADIWRRHENPWIAQHLEDVTAWMQRILATIQDAMAAALDGRPVGELRKSAAWERPDEAAREAVRARLAALSPSAWALADWLDFAELLIADNLPDDVIRDMGDFMTVRAQLSGRLAAQMQRVARPVPGERVLAGVVAALPMRRRGMPPKLLTPIEQAVLDIAAERAAIFISDIADDTRKRIKKIVVDGVQARVLGERDGTNRALQSRLFDEFGQLNRDFRRIAVTEMGEAHNTGFVAGHPVGTRIRRVEAYRGACEFCASIDGRTFRVADPSDPKRDGERDVWVGKTNAGRRASPKRRDGAVLVERSPDQRWWVAAGVMHPHCRGRWTLGQPEGDDPRVRGGADAAVLDRLRASLKAAGL